MYLKGGGRLKTCRSAPVMKIVEKKENENLGIIFALCTIPLGRVCLSVQNSEEWLTLECVG